MLSVLIVVFCSIFPGELIPLALAKIDQDPTEAGLSPAEAEKAAAAAATSKSARGPAKAATTASPGASAAAKAPAGGPAGATSAMGSAKTASNDSISSDRDSSGIPRPSAASELRWLAGWRVDQSLSFSTTHLFLFLRFSFHLHWFY